jgi:hypothetical protein
MQEHGSGPSSYEVDQAARRDAYEDDKDASLGGLLAHTPESMEGWVRLSYDVCYHVYRTAGLVATAAQADAAKQLEKASLRFLVAGKSDLVQAWLTSVYRDEYTKTIRAQERKQGLRVRDRIRDLRDKGRGGPFGRE